MKTVLVIDDNQEFRETICSILLDADFDVYDVSCPDDAFTLLKEERVDIIICDLHMPFTTGPQQDEFETSYRVGIRTIQELAWVFPNLPIIAVTAAMPIDIPRLRAKLDGVPCLAKPCKSYEILAAVAASLSGPVTSAEIVH